MNQLGAYLLIAQQLPDLVPFEQWIGYKLKPSKRPGKLDKLPINPHTGGMAMTNTPDTWGTFEAAVKAVKRHHLDGIGFVFTRQAGIVGVDLDSCISSGGILEVWASRIVGELKSYTEYSPSGTGLHVLLRGVLPPGRRKIGQIEMYDEGRFFTVTGRPISGFELLQNRPAEIVVLHERLTAQLKGKK